MISIRLILVSLLLSLGTVAACGGDDDEGSEQGEGDENEEPAARHGLSAEQAGELLVKVGETEITVGEFADRLADQSPYLRARYNTPERRREFLDNLIRFELLAAEAERRGLGDLPEVARTRKQVMIQQMMKERFEDRIRLADVTDEEVRSYYEEHRSEFNKPAQVRASHIFIKNRAAAQRVLNQILAAPDDVALFRQLAEEHNEDPETSRGSRRGDLRFFSRDGSRSENTGETEPPVAAAVAEAAFGLDRIGAVYSELVETPDGYHILKVTGRRAALERTLEEARRPIQNRLWREKREGAVEDFVARLRREAMVEANAAALESVRVDLEGVGSPVQIPNVPTPAAMTANPAAMSPAAMSPAAMSATMETE
ncbi:MAG: peptidyl-prolyl cis-trans isomerase [Myxococcota bacterium]